MTMRNTCVDLYDPVSKLAETIVIGLCDGSHEYHHDHH